MKHEKENGLLTVSSGDSAPAAAADGDEAEEESKAEDF
jgi:hypothetical protein